MSNPRDPRHPLALRRFGDAAHAYQLALQACRDALTEVLDAQRECAQLGIMVTMPGLPGSTPPATRVQTPAPATPADGDEEIRNAIRNSNPAAFVKPPKTS